MEEATQNGGFRTGDRMREIRHQSSMNYWWPRLQETDVYTPATAAVAMEEHRDYDGFDVDVAHWEEVTTAIEKVGGVPVFIRTDQASNKHDMGRASRLESTDKEAIYRHQFALLEHHLMAGFTGLPWDTLYVREWLNLWHKIKSFHEGQTPIAAEVRFFIHDGEVHDYGFYWPENSIWARHCPDNWRELWRETRDIALQPHRIEAATEYAEWVAERFDGYWSVDFALTESDQWYCIDMARGEVSWHPDGIDRLVDDPRENPLATDGGNDIYSTVSDRNGEI